MIIKSSYFFFFFFCTRSMMRTSNIQQSNILYVSSMEPPQSSVQFVWWFASAHTYTCQEYSILSAVSSITEVAQVPCPMSHTLSVNRMAETSPWSLHIDDQDFLKWTLSPLVIDSQTLVQYLFVLEHMMENMINA